MYRQGNWTLWVPAAIGAYFLAGCAYYAARFISNSNAAAGFVALIAFAGAFLAIVTRANSSVIDIKHPPALLVEMAPIQVLAEVKDTLATRYFGDKRWSLDHLNEQKRVAFFACKLKEQPFKDKGPEKERIVTLAVTIERLATASALTLHYDITGDTLTHHAALKLCQETTEHIARHMTITA